VENNLLKISLILIRLFHLPILVFLFDPHFLMVPKERTFRLREQVGN